MLDALRGRIGGYLIAWGSPDQRDLHGEFFTPQTDLALDWYAQRPVLYQHGLDGHLKTALIGVIDTLQADEIGIWAEAQLHLHHRYLDVVSQLIEDGILGWSSGSVAHLVDVDAEGHIRRFPIIEGSLTPTPAEPRRTQVNLLKKAYKTLGLNPEPFLPIQPPDKRKASMTETHFIPNSTRPRKRLPVPEMDAVKSANIRVASPYDPLDAMDMLHGYMLLRHAKNFHGVSETYANALAHKVDKARIVGIKADELSHSVSIGYGDDWVPELWSAQIWQKAHAENVVLSLFNSIEMPSNPFDLPIEGIDPVVHYVPETTDEAHLTFGAGNPIPDSRIGTGKVQLNAKKLALRVGFSAELVEDSVVPVLKLYREQAMRAILNSIDYALLNGDTNTSAGNINSDAAVPPATARYLAFDGLRKLPLLTSNNAVDAQNDDPTLALLRQTRFALPSVYATRPQEMAWIVDGATYAKLLSAPEFLTVDKAGAHATVLSGQIGFIDGSPVLVSSEMPLTESDGKIGAGTADRGTALCVYRPGWYVGYRRKIAVSVDYLPYYDSYQLTATVRLAFTHYDPQVANMLYNIAI